EKNIQSNDEKNQSYLFSIVTPCFNGDLKLFEKAFNSIKNQTIGFENIEWVVVSHNSSEDNTNSIKKIVENYENVKVYVLKNEMRTPSSPRNYALDRVSGKYVAFLDADDYYSLDLLETVSKYLKDSKPQIISFRFKTESDTKDRQPINPYVLIDQTKKVIEVDVENWDTKNFIYGTGLMITTKVYERDFLNENKIRFDEEVPLAEDNLFNLECFHKSKKIIFLPQLIGYHYLLNGGSMVQSFAKSSDEVLRYAKGIKKIFDRGLAYGFYMNNVMWDLMGYESAILLASTNLNYEDRKEVSDLLSPYLDIMEDIEVSKLYSEKTAKLIMSLPKIAIGHPRLMQSFASLMNTLKIDIASKIQI
ncbi:glycosyltransferase, partial [Methanobrevibacter sp. OttesenSCG-928-K11]|nr:glycosyltransferase [Methanobrevibacter sp. OttesenSCG-928-K11]